MLGKDLLFVIGFSPEKTTKLYNYWLAVLDMIHYLFLSFLPWMVKDELDEIVIKVTA